MRLSIQCRLVDSQATLKVFRDWLQSTSKAPYWVVRTGHSKCFSSIYITRHGAANGTAEDTHFAIDYPSHQWTVNVR